MIGVCVSGDFSGPLNGQACYETITNTFTRIGDATWSFRECPDLLECSLGRHNCVENADCNETRALFECNCQRGYKGVGNVSCTKTCYHDCVHGVCQPDNRSAEEFECECSLGWMGPACDTDCLCNNHSTCDRGPGHCDLCHNFTTGATCDQCVPNSYGLPRTSAGCAPCQCNSHGDPNGECDQTSGICNCVDRTMGDQCTQCQPGYFGEPRDGGECFECYYGRTVIENFSGTSRFGSRLCHRGVGLSNANTFLWLFNLYDTLSSSPGPADLFSLTFELSGVDAKMKNPVYIYDTVPDSILNGGRTLATLTDRDVGVVVSSSTGMIVVTYHMESSSKGDPDAVIKFKMTRRRCSEECLSESSQCSPDNECICGAWYIGINCQTKLECVSKANSSELACGSNATHVEGRHDSAQSELGDYWFIHGGITSDGTILDDLILINKDRQSPTIQSVNTTTTTKPSHRYGHAMACLSRSCYIYGGVTSSAVEATAISDYVGSSRFQLYVSHQFWEVSLDQSPGLASWIKRENRVTNHANIKVIPPLSGHTLTSYFNAVLLTTDLLLIGGITQEAIWNTDVYRYARNTWYIMPTSGARPQGLIRHTSAFHPATRAMYVIPGYEPTSSRATENGLYILVVDRGVWSRVPFMSLVPRTGHYLFSSADFLVLAGGDATDADLSDTKDNLSVYSYVCARWSTYRLTDVSGNLRRASTLGYSFLFDANSTTEGVLLVVSSDQTTTLVSSTRIDLRLCGPTATPGQYTNPRLVCGTSRMDFSETCSIDTSNGVMPCNRMRNCEICAYTLPYNNSQLCTFNNGSCYRNIFDRAVVCETYNCRVYSSCLSCTRSPGCEWVVRSDGTNQAHCETFTGSPSFSNRHTTSPDLCPTSFNATTCESCLGVHPSYSSASNLWNLNYQYCMASDLVAILDVGQVGNVVSSLSSCLKDCSANHHCSSCLSQPHCGWCSVDGYLSVDGVCLEGTRNASSLCSVEMIRSRLQQNLAVSSVEWNFLTCPPEDECLNKHHTCNETVQKCVDQRIGFKCECLDGYKAVSVFTDPVYENLCPSQWSLPAHDVEGDIICVPICEGQCGEHGCCAAANVCDCNLGYVGEQCQLECECHGYSDCRPDNLALCLNCTGHTAGAHCESCLPEFVGNPTANEKCRSCLETCNMRSDVCEGTEENLPQGVGPSSADVTRCTDCEKHSEGRLCEKCEPGYFTNQSSKACEACMCNGHGVNNRCDPDTGANCQCTNNTVSSDASSFSHQCDSCQTGYEGTPASDRQCYNLVNPENPTCFDTKSSSACLPLSNGQAAYYVLHLVNGKYFISSIDVRLTISVSSGVADIYIAKSPNAFIITFDPETNKHVVTIDQSKEAMTDPLFPRNQKYKRSTQEANSDTIDILETDAAEKYATYHHFLPVSRGLDTVRKSVVMKLKSVRHRAVIVFPSDKFEFGLERFYVIVMSREDGTSGRLRFTQHHNKIDIMVFISVFVSALLLFLCFAAIVWKMRSLQRIRQQMNEQQVERHAMAARPFSSKIVYMNFDNYNGGGASYVPYNIVPLALEPISNSTAVVATVFMMLPGDQSRPVKAAVASTLITWKLSLPPPSRGRERVRHGDSSRTGTAETAL